MFVGQTGETVTGTETERAYRSVTKTSEDHFDTDVTRTDSATVNAEGELDFVTWLEDGSTTRQWGSRTTNEQSELTRSHELTNTATGENAVATEVISSATLAPVTQEYGGQTPAEATAVTEWGQAHFGFGSEAFSIDYEGKPIDVSFEGAGISFGTAGGGFGVGDNEAASFTAFQQQQQDGGVARRKGSK